MAETSDQQLQKAPSRRLPNKREVERFDRILDAAAALFAEVDFDAVTTDDIAARAANYIGRWAGTFPR